MVSDVGEVFGRDSFVGHLRLIEVDEGRSSESTEVRDETLSIAGCQ